MEDNATVIIRAHGIPKATYELLSMKKFNVVDATCPFVKKYIKLLKNTPKTVIKLLLQVIKPP